MLQYIHENFEIGCLWSWFAKSLQAISICSDNTMWYKICHRESSSLFLLWLKSILLASNRRLNLLYLVEMIKVQSLQKQFQYYSFTEHINARFQLHAFVYAKIQFFRYCYFGLIVIVRCLCRYSLPCSTQLDTLSLKVSRLYPKKTSFSLMRMITIFNEGVYSSVNRWTSGPLENCTQNN